MSLGSRQRDDDDDGDTKDLLCHLGCDAARVVHSTAHQAAQSHTSTPPPIWFGGALHCSLMLLSCFQRTRGVCVCVQDRCIMEFMQMFSVFCVKVHTSQGVELRINLKENSPLIAHTMRQHISS